MATTQVLGTKSADYNLLPLLQNYKAAADLKSSSSVVELQVFKGKMATRLCRTTACGLLLFASATTAFVSPEALARPPVSACRFSAPAAPAAAAPAPAATRRTLPLWAGASDAFQAAIKATTPVSSDGSFTDWGAEGAVLSDTWEVDVYSRPVCVCPNRPSYRASSYHKMRSQRES